MKRIISILILLFMVITPLMTIITGNKYDVKSVESPILSSNLPVKEVNTISKTDLQLDTYEIAIENMEQEMVEIENITDKKEWFIAYNEIIDKYKDFIDPPETIYDYFSDEELDMFFRVVQAEIGDEYSFEQKANVANVILNRLYNEEFGGTMFEVLTADQFCTVRTGKYKEVEVSDTTILACEYAFCIEDTTDGCLFFDNNMSLNYEFVFSDSAHNFYTLKGEENE